MKFSQLGLILLAASALLLVACDKGSESPTAPPPKEEQADDNKPQPKVDPKEVEPKADPITPLLAPLQQAATLGTHGAARAGRAQRADLTLPIEIQRRFAAIHGDDDPDALVRDAHYYVSNENTHELFYDHIKDQGGPAHRRRHRPALPLRWMGQINPPGAHGLRPRHHAPAPCLWHPL